MDEDYVEHATYHIYKKIFYALLTHYPEKYFQFFIFK
jgi:hypothetical protein